MLSWRVNLCRRRALPDSSGFDWWKEKSGCFSGLQLFQEAMRLVRGIENKQDSSSEIR